MKKAFTLIELLVVIAIISLLASIVLSSLGTARMKARDTQRLQALKEIQKAIELKATDNGGLYPSTDGGWDCLAAGECIGSGQEAMNLLAPYLTDEKLGQLYTYDQFGNIAYAAGGGGNSKTFWYQSSANQKDYKLIISTFENLDNIPVSLREPTTFETCGRFAASVASSDSARSWPGPTEATCN
jgi:prepilin-type N-terminal cleavage/methylation domain-containing protein